MAFAELCAKSSFSFLEGASHPEEIVARAKELGLSAVALVDRDGLYGSVRAHRQSRISGEPVIVGAELTLGEAGEAGLSAQGLCSLVLLVEDAGGYENLCGLLTRGHARCDKGASRVSIAEVAEASAGLFALAPLSGNEARGSGAEGACRDLARIREAFGERARIAAVRRRDGRDAERTAAAIGLGERLGLGVVASARPLFHHPSKKPIADVLTCIRLGLTLDRAGPRLLPNAEATLRSEAQMRALFADRPAWVEETEAVAERCRFSMDRVAYQFPSDSLCAPGETPDEALERFCEAGLVDRYPAGAPARVRAQVTRELAMIRRLRVAPYFLSAREVVAMARARRILCQGRGSAANSAVCFVLGVTAVDPARAEMLFERFLSAERNEPPDIDVDFEHERREEIIQAIYETYGRDRAAMVSEVICFRGKSALAEVAKVFGLSEDQAERLSGLAGHEALSEKRVREAGLDPKDARLQKVVFLARALEGLPRHMSIHVGGFVLSAAPLSRVCPVEPARMEGRTVIPWDKDDLEELHFFKLDVLGLGIMTAIRKALAWVHESASAPSDAPFDPIRALAEIPAEDGRVYDAIGRADTVGVFQIESRAQMAMLPRLRPRTFYDLVIEVAIVRPGPIQGGMVHPYLRRRTGEEPRDPPHPLLEPILARTLGVPLFQEQVMQIAMVGAGYRPDEADQLRRDMAAWKKHGRLARHRARLERGFAARGIDRAFSERLYQQIQGFAEYGFPESHAASFALLVYASAWLKVHHPAAFAAALLSSQPMGFYSPSAIVQDAQRHGVVFLPACVSKSAWDHALEPEPGREGEASVRGPVRLGLRLVKGLGEAAARALESARLEAPFEGPLDLVRRSGLKKNEVEALAEAGALEALCPARREALWRARAPREGGLFEGLAIEEEAKVGLPKLAPVEQLALDYGRLGLSLEDHPLGHLRGSLGAAGVIPASRLAGLAHGVPVKVAGLVTGRQRPQTAKGVTFVTLEDESGNVNVVVYPDVFAAHERAARHAKILLVEGRLERQGAVVHVIARALERLEMRGVPAIGIKSRDYR